jgi:Spy/CpxP family protein refolding chaperone
MPEATADLQETPMIKPISRPLLLALLLTTTACAQAQDPVTTTAAAAAPRAVQGDVGRPGPREPGARMDELTATLGLDAKQRQAFEDVLKQRHQAMRAEREQMRAQMEAMRKKRDEIDAQYDARIAKLLTPEQYGKFQAWEKELRQSHRGRGKRGRDGRPPRDEDGPPMDGDRP